MRKSAAARETRELNALMDWLGIIGKQTKAMSEATYFACMKVLAEAVGKLPLKLLRYTGKNGVTNAREHPLYSIIKNRPNPYMTSTVFWSTVEYNRNHHGNAYALITGAGASMQLWILESDRVQIVNDDKDLFGGGANKIYYAYSGTNGLYVFASEEVLHFRNSCTLDGVTGISVRDQLKMTIDGNSKAQLMLNRLYDNGYTGKMVLQYTGDLSDANVERLVKGFERYAQSRNTDGEPDTRTIIPVPLGMKLEPLSVKLTDGQFLEIKKYSALQIASAFGIKPNQIGDYEKSSYASAEAQQLAFYVDTLLYIIKQYEEEISFKLLSASEVAQGLHFKFNVAVILRADLQTQISTLSTAVGNFIYTPNEARALLDLESKEGGDSLLGNGAAIPVQYAGIQYSSTSPEASGVQAGDTDADPTASDDVETVSVDRVLNGAQTASLVAVVVAFREGKLTYHQAANIIAVAIGLTVEEAENLLGDPHAEPEHAATEEQE